MKKILALAVLVLSFSCTTKKYESIDDFVGEYIAFDQEKKPILEGKTFLKIEKKEDGYYYTFPELLIRWEYGKEIEDKILSQKIRENTFLTKEGIDLLKSQAKMFTSQEIIDKDIISFQEAGIKDDISGINYYNFELYKVKKGKKYSNLKGNGIQNGELITDFYTKFNLPVYHKILDTTLQNLEYKIIFLEKIK